MSISLLPPNFDDLTRAAVDKFWNSRGSGVVNISQGGGRDAVVGGKNMDGFVSIVHAIVEHCGLPADIVHVRKSQVVLPGFFRATKNWDVLVIYQHRLLGVFEFKSQVGSFGNNFNNRSEEVIGSAADLWVAHHHGAYGSRMEPRVSPDAQIEFALAPSVQSDPRPPFLAWLMLLEESEASMRSVRCDEPHYPVFPEFQGASYARRYQILCERLVERQLYSAAALELTVKGELEHRALSPATSIRNLFSEFSGRLLAAQHS
ncbi:PaeR7I family type II restriction endonuclease [Lysobacter yananisis]|uniref:PaeR7I family type II restriction endonuclease n=1 Tax=Lysobacter yananisis TaxID=1003114 RepID=A0ABY9PDN0_9GAMM|nr:PaeR7I family type II restriction endonuclease [Lysobacter yananisis]WMT05044.1 PaeR7I family type II restriction endonuclease [Lysobacter yananisis]